MPFIIASKKLSLGINLIKYVQDFYNEKYKALKKETVEYTRRWKDLQNS
jgi:hypothetical protein